MLGTLADLFWWAVLVVVGLIVVGGVLFFLYDTVATFRESRRSRR